MVIWIVQVTQWLTNLTFMHDYFMGLFITTGKIFCILILLHVKYNFWDSYEKYIWGHLGAPHPLHCHSRRNEVDCV